MKYHKWEVRAWLVVFALLFVATGVIPQSTLDMFEIPILLMVILPFLAWFGRLVIKEIKQE